MDVRLERGTIKKIFGAELKSFKDFEQAGWHRSSSEYHNLFGRGTAQAAEPLLDAVGANKDMHLLDVACGTGIVSEAATARGCVVVGLDFAPGMLAAARGRYPEIKFKEGNAEHIPFANTSFGAVTCNFGLHHFPRANHALVEAHRVLAPGGRYAFTSWSPDSTQNRLVNEAVRVHGNSKVQLPKGPDKVPFHDPEVCRRILTTAGFAEPTVTEIPIVLKCATGEDLLDIIYKSTVRTRALLEAQEPATREKIDHTIAEAAMEYETDSGIELPMPAIMASARKD